MGMLHVHENVRDLLRVDDRAGAAVAGGVRRDRPDLAAIDEPFAVAPRVEDEKFRVTVYLVFGAAPFKWNSSCA